MRGSQLPQYTFTAWCSFKNKKKQKENFAFIFMYPKFTCLWDLQEN